MRPRAFCDPKTNSIFKENLAMQAVINTSVWTGFAIALTGAFLLSFDLFMCGATVWGIAALIDYARN
jgi:hypothetical protein